ncbi:unnamed protein product [Cylicocyclus nassatus]|uniref:SCP domain-containing protein n=1 Tax=Cylicocyclus nassatus TaxID=53992 RepID=A0AA36GP87_CYLNA|nr:unnamed protein product [Cylicocyclus nassatus]
MYWPPVFSVNQNAQNQDIPSYKEAAEYLPVEADISQNLPSFPSNRTTLPLTKRIKINYSILSNNQIFNGVRPQDSTTNLSGRDASTATTEAGGKSTSAAAETTAHDSGGETTGAGGSTAAGEGSTAAKGATTGTGAGAETTEAGETGETTAAGSTTTGAGAGETTTTGQKETEARVPPANNQMCPGNKRTTDKIRKKALNLTNWRRSVLAQGQVVKRNGVYMPTAANMQKLENRYYIPKSDVASAEAPRVDAMAASIKEWWKRVRLDDPVGLHCHFRAKHQSIQVRTFTRMAWANTNKISCTVQGCGDRWHTVCLYSPFGNQVEERIYIPGTTCSACPAGTFCNGVLGLCEAPES